jgi:hypothetical protein
MEALENTASVAGIASLIEQGRKKTILFIVVDYARGTPLNNLMSNRVDAHAVLSHVEHSINRNVIFIVITRA